MVRTISLSPALGADRPAAVHWIATGVIIGLAAFAGIAAAGTGNGLAVLLSLLTAGVSLIVLWFSRRYMRADARPNRFVLRVVLLASAVLLLLTAQDLVSFAVAWVCTGWLLADLIGHVRDWAEARSAARRARLSFLLGDVSLLVALGLLGAYSGSWSIDHAVAYVSRGGEAPAAVIAILLLVAAAARCALPPFSGWLLSSIAAPTPVSALMHAGLVNAGGFLLLRFAPALEAAPVARYAAVAVGCVAALYGAGIMLIRPDIKRSLAGSTVSQMGFMIMSCGLGAYSAALWHLIAHGMFKAWLFLGSGSAIGRRYGKAALGPGAVMLIAALTLALGTGMIAYRPTGAGSVPLLLAMATAIATAVAIGHLEPNPRGGVGMLVAAGFAAATYTLGFWLTGKALGSDGPALLGPLGEFVLIGVFLLAWVWQQLCAARVMSLPPWLYVRLINAGAFAHP
jgi:NAD(P)H-quinone oxidoreductase subunit 5